MGDLVAMCEEDVPPTAESASLDDPEVSNGTVLASHVRARRFEGLFLVQDLALRWIQLEAAKAKRVEEYSAALRAIEEHRHQGALAKDADAAAEVIRGLIAQVEGSDEPYTLDDVQKGPCQGRREAARSPHERTR